MKSYDIKNINDFSPQLYKSLIHEYNQNISSQKEMRKNLYCIYMPQKILFPKDGIKFNDYNIIKNISKILLENFDMFCTQEINKININNMIDIQIKIENKHKELNELFKKFCISIDEQYLKLKLNEAELKFHTQYLNNLQKEIEKAQKECIREQTKEQLNLEKEKESLVKELTRIKNNKTYTEGDSNILIHQIEHKIKEIDYALTHEKAGYIYVVSNNDMSAHQYKIGVTRRNIEERMKELGAGASHSFDMNLHGYVYVDECFEIESKIHNYLKDKRVNQLNPHKEWFLTDLETIVKAFYEVAQIQITLTETTNEEYIYSQNYFNNQI